MKYLPSYLRQYARQHQNDNEINVVSETNVYCEKTIVTPIYLTLPYVLNEAADEIETLREKIKQYEKLEKIIQSANKLSN